MPHVYLNAIIHVLSVIGWVGVGVGIYGIVYSELGLRRNRWVFEQRTSVLHTDMWAYDQLPDYSVMMKRWWIKDVALFVAEKDRERFRDVMKNGTWASRYQPQPAVKDKV